VKEHFKARTLIEVLGVLLVSIALVWFVRAEAESNTLAEGIWLFYLPGWLVVLTLFGGAHGAPTGSEVPVFVMSFTAQNLVLWYFAKWILRRAKAPTREA
jgi:hypothetical protein